MLYQRETQFSRGEEASLAIPDGPARALQEKKQKLALQLQKDIKGLRSMLLDHARKQHSSGSERLFFTLPAAIFDRMQVARIEATAVSTGAVPLALSTANQVASDTFALDDLASASKSGPQTLQEAHSGVPGLALVIRPDGDEFEHPVQMTPSTSLSSNGTPFQACGSDKVHLQTFQGDGKLAELLPVQS